MRDHIQASRNHFPYLEEAAETLAGALGDPLAIAEPLRRRLLEGFGIEARVVPPELIEGASQHYDLHCKRLMLSALLRPESRALSMANSPWSSSGHCWSGRSPQPRRPTRRPASCST